MPRMLKSRKVNPSTKIDVEQARAMVREIQCGIAEYVYQRLVKLDVSKPLAVCVKNEVKALCYGVNVDHFFISRRVDDLFAADVESPGPLANGPGRPG